MRLTDHTDYSLRVLMYLNQTKSQTTLNELADNLGISRNNLIKVSRQLAKRGWVDASRGRTGGLAIKSETGNLTLREIIVHTEESFNVAECFSNNGCKCTFIKACSLQASLKLALNAFFESLGQTTLNEVTTNIKMSTQRKGLI